MPELICRCSSANSILLSYLRFHYGLRHKGIDRKTLPYRAPLQPYLSYYGLVGILIILLFCGFGSFMPSFSVSLYTMIERPAIRWLLNRSASVNSTRASWSTVSSLSIVTFEMSLTDLFNFTDVTTFS